MGQDRGPGVEDEFVLVDPDRGVHVTVGSILGVPDIAAAEDATERRPVLLGQTRLVSHKRACCGGSAHSRLSFRRGKTGIENLTSRLRTAIQDPTVRG